jgi:ABC-type polysaccharide/polyol phosphate transport system ATPase subunit
VSSLSASELSQSEFSASKLSAPNSARPVLVAKPAISVRDLDITYRVSLEARPTLKGAIVRLGRPHRSIREIEAVKNVSFDVAKGSVLGIIGANGAGKSTLMRAVAGILPPTKGAIEIHGRVSTLLALGVGFNGMLTGRQNVVLGSLAAGLSRAQIQLKYDEIAAFAELGDFMDMPMRTYSSGMYSRLAFSVAVNMDPDILLIDEAMSAGDAKFRKKASARMLDIANKAGTMLLVSHALGTIKDMCSEAIWLHQGRLIQRGEPDDVVAAYARFLEVGENALTLEDI